MKGFGVCDRFLAVGVFIGLVVNFEDRVEVGFGWEDLSMRIEMGLMEERFASVVEFLVVAVDDLVRDLASRLGYGCHTEWRLIV